jgi:hypothetical protein
VFILHKLERSAGPERCPEQGRRPLEGPIHQSQEECSYVKRVRALHIRLFLFFTLSPLPREMTPSISPGPPSVFYPPPHATSLSQLSSPSNYYAATTIAFRTYYTHHISWASKPKILSVPLCLCHFAPALLFLSSLPLLFPLPWFPLTLLSLLLLLLCHSGHILPITSCGFPSPKPHSLYNATSDSHILLSSPLLSAITYPHPPSPHSSPLFLPALSSPSKYTLLYILSAHPILYTHPTLSSM